MTARAPERSVANVHRNGVPVRPYAGSIYWLFAALATTVLIGAMSQWLLLALVLILVGPLLGVAWFVILGFAGIEAWPLRNAPLRAASLVLAPCIALGLAFGSFQPVVRLTFDGLTRMAFLRNRASYDRIVQLAARNPFPSREPGESQVHRGVEFIVDPGPPVRLAFPTGVGFLDNWSATVYDPSAAVGAARGYTATGFSAPRAVHQLFGGDIVWCRRLGGPYYHCGFPNRSSYGRGFRRGSDGKLATEP